MCVLRVRASVVAWLCASMCVCLHTCVRACVHARVHVLTCAHACLSAAATDHAFLPVHTYFFMARQKTMPHPGMCGPDGL